MEVKRSLSSASVTDSASTKSQYLDVSTKRRRPTHIHKMQIKNNKLSTLHKHWLLTPSLTAVYDELLDH